MNRDEIQHLLSERSALTDLLKDIPPEDALDRASAQARLEEVERRLAAARLDTRAPARARLTFRGKPVIGSRGIFAEFGMSATRAFIDTVAKVAASLQGPLASMGPVPNRAQNQLLITSTAAGSFGFELEEHRDEPLLIDDGSVLAAAMAATQALFEATAGDDETLADAAAGMEPRTIAAARTFLQELADHEAVCTLEVGDKPFAFPDVGQVRRSLTRLATDNLIEAETTKTGEFQGVLPKSRTFEFRLRESGEVIKGKVGPGVTDPDAINGILHKPMTITLAETRVGSGKPRYTLNTMPDAGRLTTRNGA